MRVRSSRDEHADREARRAHGPGQARDGVTCAYTRIAASDVQVSVEAGDISVSAMDGESDVYRFGGGPSASDDARLPTAELDAWQQGLLSVTSPEGETTSYHYDPSGHRDVIGPRERC